jgi:hypothetical protein
VRAAPAVAVAGALAACPQVRDLVTGTPAVAAGQAAARIGDPGRVTLMTDDATPFQSQARFAQRAKAASARHAARAAAAARHSSEAAANIIKGRHHAPVTAAPPTAASPKPTPPPATPPPAKSPGAPVCTGSGGMLPQNFATIVAFLTANGYTGVAAAGIAGNIYQESGGNPESGSSAAGGLIGWTPLPAGYITGNAAADLQTQLKGILSFNKGWSQYLPALNAASSPAAAADIYVTDFERASAPAAGTREASANAVAAACHI